MLLCNMPHYKHATLLNLAECNQLQVTARAARTLHRTMHPYYESAIIRALLLQVAGLGWDLYVDFGSAIAAIEAR